MRTANNYRVVLVALSAFILIICFLIKIASFFPNWIERNYSRGIYPYISSSHRFIFGWLPFSFGDLLYAAVAVWLLLKLVKLVKVLRNRRYQNINYKRAVIKTFFILTPVYIYFNLSWGLNYNRPGIAYQLGLKPKSHNGDELKLITGLLIKKVNDNRLLLGRARLDKPHQQIFSQADTAYEIASADFPFLRYKTMSLKKSMYGRMGNFLGFLGYYNPFTGEAQVNLTQPRFLIPFVSCHEIAHQLGYASESEANFVGYLAAINSSDIWFHYSAYFDLFNYANRELYLRDSVAAKNNYKRLDPLVKKDVEELKAYWRKSDNPVEPLIKIFYDHYLKANQQRKGVKSYNEVIGWLIAYYQKYHKI